MDTRVVHCLHQKYDVYIGRKNTRFNLAQSKWANPFIRGIDGSREEVIKKYRDWVLDQPNLINNISELNGKILGCWCHPKRCHGDVLIELLLKSKFLNF
jgi:hypothetical protein